MRFDHLALLDNLPAYIEDGTYKDHEIIREEGSDVPFTRDECYISVCADCEYHGSESEPCAVRLPPSPVGKICSIVALSFECSVEEDIDGAHADVVDDLGSFRQVGKPRVSMLVNLLDLRDRERYGNIPADDLCRAASKLKEGKKREEHYNAETVDRYTFLGAFSEKSGRVAIESERVE